MTDQLANLGVCEAASAIARGEISSEKMTQVALDRLEKLGPKLNCVASLQAEIALDAARRADVMRSKGHALGYCTACPWPTRSCFIDEVEKPMMVPSSRKTSSLM